MTALYIIIGILLFLFVLLIIPIKSDLDFLNGVFSFAFHYGFIKAFDSKKMKKEKPEDLKDKHSKKNEKKEEKPKKKSKKPKIAKLFETKKEQLGTMEAVKYFLGILKDLLEKLVWLIKKFRFDRFRLNLVIASSDAATTAINYGYCCTAIYPILSFLSINTNLELKQVNISADFNKTAIDFDISLSIRTRLIYFLVLGIKLLFEYKKLIKEVKADE